MKFQQVELKENELSKIEVLTVKGVSGMKSKSFILLSTSFIFGFLGFVTISLYFNHNLQALLKVQASAHGLLIKWNRAESLNKEVILTYDLENIGKDWLVATRQFEADFKEFLEIISQYKGLVNDLDFKIKVAISEMHWTVVENRVKEAATVLKKYLAQPSARQGSGNLLVDFGGDLMTGDYDSSLIDLLEKLRWTTSLSRYSFSKTLADVTQHATTNVERQIYKLKVFSLALSAFILIATGFLIILHIVQLSRSTEKADSYASELAIKVRERNQVARQLKSEKDKLHALINALGQGTYVVKKDYSVEFQSQILESRFPQAIGKKCYQAFMNLDHPCDFCLSRKTIETGNLDQVETVLYDNRHHELTFSPFVDVDGMMKNIVLIRDIMARKQAEAEAVRSGYLASIGELAAGVAHEINNPINGIISLAEMAQDRAADDPLTRDISERIIKEGERIAGIVTNLLLFARDNKKETKDVTICDALQDALDLIGKQIEKDGTKIVVDMPDDLPKITAVSQEIQQVFLNLLSNSRYALNQKYTRAHKNKLIEITGRFAKIDEKKFIRIVFYDLGVGISKESLTKVGQPFYSTKPPREGTGLGLSICQEIITKYRGKIVIESEFGEFTRVNVDLPIVST